MTNQGIKTFTANGALGAKVRVKVTAASATTPPQVEVAGAGEQHIGITEYAAADGTAVAVRLRTHPGSHEGIAIIDLAISVGAVLYGAANGKISDASSGTAIGIALEAATQDNDIIEFIDFTVLSTTAATVSIADSGSLITGETVEAALAEIMKGIKTAQYTIAPVEFRNEDGTAIAAFANGGADGWTQLSNKSMALRWNNGGTPTDFMARFVLPQDLEDAAAVVLHLLGAPSGENDSPVFAVEAYFDVAGAAPGADSDCGGESGEFAASTNLQEKTLSIAHGDVPAAPTTLTVVFHPKDGELGTDDFILSGIWLEVTRKCLTA